MDSLMETSEHDEVTVLHPGIQNRDGGPDFFNARIRINNTVWAGNVELHVKASDWILHRHYNDPAYDNVILHVVYENDHAAKLRNRSIIPTLVLKNNFPRELEERYTEIMQAQQWIPCNNMIPEIAGQVFRLWAPALAAERLELKTGYIHHLLEEYGEWEEVLYIFLCNNFGFRINSLPFELLARSLPLKIIRRHADDIFILESMFFGQSGLKIKGSGNRYIRLLNSEYQHQKTKYLLKPLKPGLWKYLRLHPANFPEIRISQLVNCLVKCRTDFRIFINPSGRSELEEILCASASAYWDTHYRFGRPGREFRKQLGSASINLLIINMVVPALFACCSSNGISQSGMKAIEILEGLSAESNHEISGWRTLGLDPVNALESQALIHLKRNFCDRRRCLECRIGLKILEKESKR
jgi:hypothetical protein